MSRLVDISTFTIDSFINLNQDLSEIVKFHLIFIFIFIFHFHLLLKLWQIAQIAVKIEETSAKKVKRIERK